MNDVTEFARTLGYTPAWFALGVVDNSALDRQRAVWDSGEDNNTEHYRYSSFREFLTAQRPVSPDLAIALFELGATDADQVMGGSMMADIVRLSECPPEVLAAAMASGRKHLIAIVECRKAEQSDAR